VQMGSVLKFIITMYTLELIFGRVSDNLIIYQKECVFESLVFQ
jgi:hypothetical protein